MAPPDPIPFPESPAEQRAYVTRLRAMFRLWSDCRDYKRACELARQMREMLGEPTAEEEIEMLRLEGDANGP